MKIPRLLIAGLLLHGSLHAQNRPAPNNSTVNSEPAKAAALVAEKPAWKLGVALYAFHDVLLPDQLALAAAAGLRHIEAYAFAKTGPEFGNRSLADFTAEDVVRLENLLQSKGLELDSLYVTGGFALASWERAFATAMRLNVPYVVAEPPLELLDDIDRLAGTYGLKVAIHNHFRGLGIYWDPDVMLGALKNHPNLWACPDIGHWPRSGINPVEGLRKLKGHILGIHLKDVAVGTNGKFQEVPLGTGAIHLPDVFKELSRQNFAGWLVIEKDSLDKPDNLISVRKAMAYHNEQVRLLTGNQGSR